MVPEEEVEQQEEPVENPSGDEAEDQPEQSAIVDMDQVQLQVHNQNDGEEEDNQDAPEGQVVQPADD